MPDEPRSESAPARVGGAARGLAGALGGAVVREAKTWLRWATGGAVVGGLGAGGFGAYLLGFTGLLWGTGIGVAVGSVGAVLFYLWLSSESLFS